MFKYFIRNNVVETLRYKLYGQYINFTLKVSRVAYPNLNTDLIAKIHTTFQTITSVKPKLF